MVDLEKMPWKTEHAQEENTSFFIELDEGVNDVTIEARSGEGVVINFVTRDGETIFVDQGDRVLATERVTNGACIELVANGPLAYRCAVQRVFEFEVLDPRPATVVETLTERDQIAIAVREEVERRLGTLRDMGVFKDDLDPDELMDDILNGDHEFDEEEDDFTSSSYEDMAVERTVEETPETPPAAPEEAPDTAPSA